MTLELALAVGKAIAQKAGGLWLKSQAATGERDKDLVELIQVRFPDQIARRRVTRQLEDIADSVAQRLQPLLAHEYRNVSAEDKAATLAEVIQTLTSADLSDETLFAADFDPVKVARAVRSKLPHPDLSYELGEGGSRLYEVVLDECCDCLVRIVRQLPQFGGRASAETLSRLTGLADQVAAVLARLPARSLDAPNGTEDDEEFKRRYLEYESETLDTLELFGIRVERYRPRTTLSVAYISLSVSAESGLAARSLGHRSTFHGKEPWSGSWRAEKAEDPATVRVETALSQSRLMLIRGEAGSGKSTLLRWLAIAAARGSFAAGLASWNGCIPFLIKLRSHVDGQLPRPEQFLDDTAGPLCGLMPTGWIHRQLLSGRGLLLVDGVDELPGGRRRAVRQWLSDLINAYPQMRIIITSRPAAAGSDWLAAEGFTAAILERMSPSDVRALIRHWHDAVRDCDDLPCPIERLPSYEAALLARLEAAPHLRVLAATPLLAAMLCALNLDRDTQLPRDRMGLYAAVLELLLERRDAERHIPSFQEITLEREQKLRILQDLAWRLSITSRTELPSLTAERRIEEKLATMPRVSATAAAMLDHLLQRSGVIREPIPGRIDFVHRTVQEYLTAKQAADDGDMEPLITNAHRDQWRETIIMAAGHANAPLRHQLLAGLLHRAQTEPRRARAVKLLITSCLETLPSVPADLSDNVQACLNEMVPPQSIRAAHSLATVGEPVLDRLPRTLDGLTEAAARATVRVAWLINGPDALRVLTTYGRDKRHGVQTELIKGWEYFDPDDYARQVLSHAPLPMGHLSVSTSAQLRAARHLRHLHALRVELSQVPDLSFLEGLRSLSHLTVYSLNSGDLSPLISHGGNLLQLDLRGTIPIDDPTPLTQLRKLTHVDLAMGNLTDLTFVRDLAPLKSLRLSNLDDITDYSSIAAHESLESLGLSECPNLSDIDVLPPLGNITELGLTNSNLACGLEAVVAAAPRTSCLFLHQSRWVNDLTCLCELSLQVLGLWDCAAVNDITPLASQADLRMLDLEGTRIRDLSPLSGLTKLQTLWLGDCPSVDDLTPLSNLRMLRYLYIEGIAPGTDLAPLASNRRLNISIFDDQEVGSRDLFGNRIIISPRQETLFLDTDIEG